MVSENVRCRKGFGQLKPRQIFPPISLPITGRSMNACRFRYVFCEPEIAGILGRFLLENFAAVATIIGGGCELVAEGFFLNFGASSAGRMVVNSLMTLEMDAGPDVDPVEEMRLRTWARKNYAPAEERDDGWHPIVLDEMDRKDQESNLMAVLV